MPNLIFLLLVCAFLLRGMVLGEDDVRPTRFGPFLQQAIAAEASPSGFLYIPPFGSYRFLAGWVEPISVLPWGIFRGTYIESEAEARVSPFQSDVGTAFNLRPLRFIEVGLGYRRLLFHNTLVGFNSSTDSAPNALPDPARWRADEILHSTTPEVAAADVFTFQGNLTLEWNRFQFFAGGFRSLWDVDIQDHEILFEYSSDLLIRKRDRINSVYGQAFWNLETYLSGLGFTLRGFKVRNQYWWTSQTELSKNLVAGGISGLSWGHNSDRRFRGLDLLFGYWTQNPQLDHQGWKQHLYLTSQWIWNIQVLNLSEN